MKCKPNGKENSNEEDEEDMEETSKEKHGCKKETRQVEEKPRANTRLERQWVHGKKSI